MQYSTLKSAYGVPELSGNERKEDPPAPQRDWTVAPGTGEWANGPRPQLSMPPTPPPAVMPTNTPLQVPSVQPMNVQATQSPMMTEIPAVPQRMVHYAIPEARQMGMPSEERGCISCRRTRDREFQMLVLYVSTGSFFLLFVDILVRLALQLSKKR